MKQIIKSSYFKAFILSGILASIFIIPQILKNSGIFMIFADYNSQQIPFNELANNLIKNGNTNYTYLNDLGSNFIGSFSFYNLGSPFFWITLLFPGSFFKYLGGPIFILKYAFAGLFSFIFLKRYIKNENYAILGSLLYAFSGFQITNMLFYHFHDVVALFPLLLIGLDKFMYDNKKGIWGLCVFLSALCNYFFFIGEVVFVFMYFIVKLLTKEYKITLKKFFILAFETIIGFGLSCILFVPSIYFTLTNPRTEITWTLRSALRFNLITFSNIVRAIFLPPQAMTQNVFCQDSNFTSAELYIPLFSCLLYFSYIIKKPKNWESILIIISIIIMFIPILNSLFVAFNPAYYARWFYMPLLIMILATIKAIEKRISLIPGIICNLLLIVIFILLSLRYKYLNIDFIYNQTYATIYIAEYIIGILLTIFILNIKKEKIQTALLFVFVPIFIIFNAFMYFFIYSTISGDLTRIRNNLYNANFSYELLDNERIDSSYYNYGYITQKPTINTWNSTVNGNIIKFYNSLGISRGVVSILNPDEYDMRNFLSVKYIVAYNEKEKNEYSKKYELFKENQTYSIYKNNDYLKIGTPYKYYITEQDFFNLQYSERKQIICHAIVLKEEQIEKYKDFMQNIMDISEEQRKNPINNSMLTKNKKGFDYTITQDTKSLVLFSFPYEEKGWYAEENGKPIPIELVDNGLMAIPIDQGNHTISFTYKTPGLRYGIIISATSLIAYLIYLLIIVYNKKKETSN